MLSSRPGSLITRRGTGIIFPPAPRLRRGAQQQARASYGGGGRPPSPPPPPPPPPPMPESNRSNAPVLYDAPPPPPPPPLPRFVTDMPTSRRNAIGASLLFVGAFLGFSSAFSGNDDNDADDEAFFKGASGTRKTGNKPYRIVDGRPFVRTSRGDILSVGRLPRNLPESDRTLVLSGEAGLFLLRLTKEAMRSVDLHSGSSSSLAREGEFLTRVFATGEWEQALSRVSPSSDEIERIMRENGMDEEVEEVEELEAEDRLLK